jgi:iron-regulated transporter 1
MADSENSTIEVNGGSKNQIDSILFKLYTSHFLSVWNSRLFEFGAILFLAVITPGTLFYASTYALVRSLAAVFLASTVGQYIDRSNRLVSIRASIILQRAAVSLSCVLFAFLLWQGQPSRLIFIVLFSIVVVLACVEKVAFVANTVSVERDWVPVIARSLDHDRSILNASMRRIDLISKLVAPVVLSVVQTYSTTWAIVFTLLCSALSMLLEYVAIARVYSAIHELAFKESRQAAPIHIDVASADSRSNSPQQSMSMEGFSSTLGVWLLYFKSPVFLASLSLSLLYLTVLSTGAQYQTYMLSIHYTAVGVSFIRVAAVISELSATCFSPLMIRHIGRVRAGLWSINWQAVSLSVGVGVFVWFNTSPTIGSSALTVAIIISRLGLWGFDLAVQDIVQEVRLVISCTYVYLTMLYRKPQSLNVASSLPVRWVCKTASSRCPLFQR